jgi:hypothetical protein
MKGRVAFMSTLPNCLEDLFSSFPSDRPDHRSNAADRT